MNQQPTEEQRRLERVLVDEATRRLRAGCGEAEHLRFVQQIKRFVYGAPKPKMRKP